jgi:chemosensory pili system protein ChpA (sensor histidine kinase/response regulator)
MVPFATLATRLQRVVRKAGTDAGKKAKLVLQLAGGSDGQLDRNILERVTAPLEHILRNAIAHGIEAPPERAKNKKPAEGVIAITVENEATALVIRIEDDGAGIDLAKIRKLAVERGLLKSREKATDSQLLNLLMVSGFSTASEVTSLAGRGVGMDVVRNEIKQIGGTLGITTTAGKGSTFTIRIPFSLAIMQAMLALVGDRQYAIPLVNVRGVSKITTAAYKKHLRAKNPSYQFAGEDFHLLELEPQLGYPAVPLGHDPIYLLMIQAGSQRAAFRVSELHDHRELVVKAVGPQISSIPGILGGSVAGDGQVMLILEMGPLIQRAIAEGILPKARKQKTAAATPEATRLPLIMVVDDSITMRKVTSRVLENSNFEVVTARDGLDAVEQLQERVPDLMLLDVEMPRMDGFELAEHVRADKRLKHIPMIMITSRSGQKHRDHAAELGVDGYLTKPYQEAELVRNVRQLLVDEKS